MTEGVEPPSDVVEAVFDVGIGYSLHNIRTVIEAIEAAGYEVISASSHEKFAYSADDVLAVCDDIRPMSDEEYAAWRESCGPVVPVSGETT